MSKGPSIFCKFSVKNVWVLFNLEQREKIQRLFFTPLSQQHADALIMVRRSVQPLPKEGVGITSHGAMTACSLCSSPVQFRCSHCMRELKKTAPILIKPFLMLCKKRQSILIGIKPLLLLNLHLFWSHLETQMR